MKYEPLGEINNQSFSQNQEFFSTDLYVYNRCKMIYANLATDGTAKIQLTFDSGTSWVDLQTSKKHNFIDLIQFPMDTTEQLNFRCTDVGGVTIQHFHVYSEYSY